MSSQPLQSEAASQKGSEPQSHLPVLDGIRAVACLAVLSYHMGRLTNLGWWPPSHSANRWLDTLVYCGQALIQFGESGVLLFFLLSGFLLFLPYARSLLFDTPWPSLRRFYLRRIFRILPGYYVTLFLLIFILHPELLHRSHWQDLWLFLTFRMNFMLSQELDGPFWTLATEFHFYLLLPILAWLFRLVVSYGTVHWRMFKLTMCLLAVVIWGLFTRYLFLSHIHLNLGFLTPIFFIFEMFISVKIPSNCNYSCLYNTANFLEVFAVGMLICIIYAYTQHSLSAESFRTGIHRLSSVLFIIGLTLLAFLALFHFYVGNIAVFNTPEYNLAFSFLERYNSIMLSLWLQWQAIAYAISYGFCFCALLHGSSRLKRPFECAILRWVAFISFSLYMWHVPLLEVFIYGIAPTMQQRGVDQALQDGAFWCWILLIIFPLSDMWCWLIEQPGILVGKWIIQLIER